MISAAARRDDAEARAARRSRCRASRPSIVDDAGKPVGIPGGGYLVLERPWPSMLRGIWGDPERYRDTYWSRFDGKYFAGDGAKRDDEGYFWLLGRVDDIMLVVGPQHLHHRGRVGARRPSRGRRSRGRRQDRRHDRPGDRRVRDPARRATSRRDALVEELRDHVAKLIGPIAKPKSILFTEELPEDPVGQDHAPAAAQRRARTRRSATPRRSPIPASSTASSRATSPPRPSED